MFENDLRENNDDSEREKLASFIFYVQIIHEFRSLVIEVLFPY